MLADTASASAAAAAAQRAASEAAAKDQAYLAGLSPIEAAKAQGRVRTPTSAAACTLTRNHIESIPPEAALRALPAAAVD
jgi:hypothetical protein